MISSVSSANVSPANAASQTAAPKPQQTQQSTPLPSDTVSLKSAGDVDKDGDSK
jgi:hypothetical protein